MEFITTIDNTITQSLQGISPHTPFFNSFFEFLSLNPSSLIIWIGLIIALLLVEELNHKKCILFFVIIFGLSTLISNYGLKNLFQRERPQAPFMSISASCPKDFSFPSTHAATAFASAALLATYDKKRRYLYFGVAILIGYSRIYLGCHFFLDVVFGALLGYCIAKMVLYRKVL